MRIALTAEHAAEALSLTVPAFLDLVRGCDLPMPVVIGQHLRWSVDALEEAVRHMDEATGPAVSKMALEEFGINLA